MISHIALQLRASAWLSIPLLAVAGLLTNRLTRHTVVVMDHWWNVKYAETGCAMRRNSRDACVLDPAAEALAFEARIATHFARSGDCRDVVLTTYMGPEANKAEGVLTPSPETADLQLVVNFISGDGAQNWSIFRRPGNHLTTGHGTPDQIAQNVCAIARQTALGHG